MEVYRISWEMAVQHTVHHVHRTRIAGRCEQMESRARLKRFPVNAHRPYVVATLFKLSSKSVSELHVAEVPGSTLGSGGVLRYTADGLAGQVFNNVCCP